MSRNTNPRASRVRRTFVVVAATGATVALLFCSTAVVPQASPVLAPAQAHAGLLCDWSGGSVCGRIYNSPSSNIKINVHNSWGPKDWISAGDVQQVAPGRSATFRDADGYCIPPNTNATVNIVAFTGGVVKRYNYKSVGRWQCQKITDNLIANVIATDTLPALVKKREAALKKAEQEIRKARIATCKSMAKEAKTQQSKYYKKNIKFFKACANEYGVKVKKK